jgi:hypothetical protein
LLNTPVCGTLLQQLLQTNTIGSLVSTGIWFREDYHWGKPGQVQDAESLNTPDKKAGLAESFSASIELHNACTGILIFDRAWSKLQIMWAYCTVHLSVPAYGAPPRECRERGRLNECMQSGEVTAFHLEKAQEKLAEWGQRYWLPLPTVASHTGSVTQ